VTVFTTNLDELGGWLPRRQPRLLDVPLDGPVRRNGVETWYFPSPVLSRFKFSPLMARELRRQLSSGQFNLIHTHGLYLYPTMMAGRYARRFGVPYIIQPHGVLDPFMRKRHRVRKAAYAWLTERRNLHGASAIHYTSNAERELASSLGLRARPFVVPLGIDLDEFSALPPRGTFRRAYPTLQGSQIVLFMGRFAEKKGLDLLIPAFAAVAAGNDRAYLILAGPDDEGYGSKVDQMIRRFGLEGRVIRPGMVTGQQRLALLTDADVWVLPSYSENFGHAVVEAMASGLPVVITDRVNIHEAVSAADAGLVIGCDVEELARSLQNLLANDDRRRELGKKGRELARAQFGWDKAASCLIEAYATLATTGRSRRTTGDERLRETSC